jgi:ribosomal-protein-alanine N-acetyltransferase
MTLPPYKTFPDLSNQRILLKHVPAVDLEEIVEISFYDGNQAINIEDTIEIYEKINSDYSAGNSIHWGIYDIASNKIVGTCGYYRGFKDQVGELGCILLHKHRRQGYMINAMKLAIKFGIEIIGLKQVMAVTTAQNERAIKLLSKIGFVRVEDMQNNELKYALRDNVVG